MYSVPSLLVLTIICFFLIKGALGVMKKEWESSGRVRELGEKATALTFREQELKEDIVRLQTEEGIKDEIKKRFSVTQEGEHIAIIVDEKRSSTSTDTSQLPWFRRFWNAIIKNK